MATTTQVTSYRAAGQPDDGVGAVGDICWDSTNRITWVKQGNNSWVNGAYSNIGPTGPAQLAGNGAPASGLGQNGNGYTDQVSGLTYLKANNAWSQSGSILGPQGPQGIQGYSALTSQAAVTTKGASFNGTVSSTAQFIPITNTSVPLSFTPLQSSALMGMSFTSSGVAVALSLVDTSNSNSIVVSISCPANANVNPVYTTTQYPLIAGHTYQWQITGSGTATFQFDPQYLMPSAGTSPVVFPLPGFYGAAGTTYSSTATYIGPYGRNNPSATCRSWAITKSQTALQNVQAQFVPATAGAASATLTIYLLLYNYSSGNTTTIGTASVTNSGTIQQTNFNQNLSMPVGNTLYSYAVGSGTGQLFYEPFIVQ